MTASTQSGTSTNSMFGVTGSGTLKVLAATAGSNSDGDDKVPTAAGTTTSSIDGTPPEFSAELRLRVLLALAANPGWTAREIAESIGEELFDVLEITHRMIERGIVGVE